MAQHTVECRPPPKRIVTLIRQKTSLVILSFGDSVAYCVIDEITCVFHGSALPFQIVFKFVFINIINRKNTNVKTINNIFSEFY